MFQASSTLKIFDNNNKNNDILIHNNNNNYLKKKTPHLIILIITIIIIACIFSVTCKKRGVCVGVSTRWNGHKRNGSRSGPEQWACTAPSGLHSLQDSIRISGVPHSHAVDRGTPILESSAKGATIGRVRVGDCFCPTPHGGFRWV